MMYRIPFYLLCVLEKSLLAHPKGQLIFFMQISIVAGHMLTPEQEEKNENQARRVFDPNEETFL